MVHSFISPLVLLSDVPNKDFNFNTVQPDQILDTHFGNSIQEYLKEGETLVWEGQPNPIFRMALLEVEGYHDVNTGHVNIPGYVMGAMLFFSFIFYHDKEWISLGITFIIGLPIIILPDILMHARKKNTKYAISQHRIFFQLWRWGKKSVHIINFSEINRITYVDYEDNNGVLYFILNNPPGFLTHDFITGQKRFHPTFEMIPNVSNLYQIIGTVVKKA